MYLQQKQEIDRIFIVDPIWLVWNIYISHSLTHSSIGPSITYPMRRLRGTFLQKNYSKVALSRFVCSSISWEQVVTNRQLYLNLPPCEKQKFQFTISN